jgi:hypothetical protein
MHVHTNYVLPQPVEYRMEADPEPMAMDMVTYEFTLNRLGHICWRCEDQDGWQR